MKKKNKPTKIVILNIIVIIILLCSTSAFAIYMATTLGTKKLSFQLNLLTDVINESTINAPKLVEGMIPVVWNETDSKWQVVSSTDTNWYNYDTTNKKWANVMMPDTTATSYSVGDEITESDLGSMFVWIPRYEYKINYYTDDTKTTSSETQTVYGTIDINFIATDITTPTTGYTIHPAFTDGTSNGFLNGEWDSKIDGFWMAKFESTINSDKVQQLPNIKNTTKEEVSKMYDKAKSATYSLSTESASLINSHMTKNSEWGAVAYLTYSQYGISGDNIYTNNYYVKNSNMTITGYYASTFNNIGNSSPARNI